MRAIHSNFFRFHGLILAAVLLMPAVQAAADADGELTPAQARAFLDEEGRIADADTLVHAALMHDAKLVAAVLASGVPADARGILPQSALHLAVTTQCAEPLYGREAQMAIIDLLLAHGADVHDKAFGNSEIIIWAAQQCPPVVVKRLLDAGADIEARSPQGFSPLSMALTVRNLDAAELLVDRGARLKPETVRKLFSGADLEPRLKALVKRASGK